ncbi:MAG TPA: hypothetical protein VLY23_01330 [Candidatus Acidoferrum sp.]|nr:hypothetical protein [Candidatus Acidoferrum sp.]
MRPSAHRRFSVLVGAAAVCLLTAFINHPQNQESTTKKRTLPDATTWKYFPQASAHDAMPYIAEFLNSSGEASLLAAAQNPAAVSYRFDAWLLPSGSFRAIRFLLNSDGSATIVKFLVPGPIEPLAAPRPNKVELKVSAEDAEKFLAFVDTSGFWSMPTVQPPNPTPPKYYVLDGAFWVFEGVRGGSYHVVYRWNPNAGPLTELVQSLGKDLAGLNESEIPSGIWPPINSPPNHGVAIQISGPVTAERPFALRVINRRSTLISFCVTCAGTIVPSPGATVPAVDVQRPGPKKWGSLLWGLDMGSCYAPTQLGSREGQEFLMKLSEPGRYRLRLSYVPRSLSASPGVGICAKLDELKGAKLVTSEEFEVLPSK